MWNTRIHLQATSNAYLYHLGGITCSTTEECKTVWGRVVLKNNFKKFEQIVFILSNANINHLIRFLSLIKNWGQLQGFKTIKKSIIIFFYKADTEGRMISLINISLHCIFYVVLKCSIDCHFIWKWHQCKINIYRGYLGGSVIKRLPSAQVIIPGGVQGRSTVLGFLFSRESASPSVPPSSSCSFSFSLK